MNGVRVQVPFGSRQVIGVVVQAIDSSAVPTEKLRSVYRILDSEPVFPKELMDLLNWASRYYHHPPGEVFTTALPVLLRKGQAAAIVEKEFYSWAGPLPVPTDEFKRAPVKARIANYLAELDGKPVGADTLVRLSAGWRSSIASLLDKGWVSCTRAQTIPANKSTATAPELSDEQQFAVDKVISSLGTNQRFLLDGVTGSGKTEVYLQCIQAASEQGLQSLVLVPEISLTPQLMRRFEQRLDGCLVSLHSGLNDSYRLQNWLCCAQGHADVVIGTRSSVLVPLPRLGLVIVDEEHDASLKQQDGFRYHARDLALLRAQSNTCPIVLGSATPSFESLNNADNGKFTKLMLTRRAGAANPPTLGLMDIRRRKLIEGMSDRMIEAIRSHIGNEGQALVFINRRGFSPTLLCNDCGAAADCRRCDANMTVHSRHKRLRCHHCGAERAIPSGCEACGSEQLDFIGYGTERIADALHDIFPDVPIARIDRDSTRRKGALEQQLARATSGDAKILVGTQMLAKGHHFPKLTLVGILDADRGLFGTDFRSLEHMGQLILQVAGRAGRETQAGSVLIQTRNPENPLLQTLVAEGYAHFADIAMEERKRAELPPYSFMAIVRAEAAAAQEPHRFLMEVASYLNNNRSGYLDVLGPAPAPMERLAGRFRSQLLLQSDKRSTLNHNLSNLSTKIDSLTGARRCRWSIDVDPIDMF